MNRIALMVLRNIFKLPGLYLKLCHYAKHTDKYSEHEKYNHIQHILKIAINSGNINLQVFGQENIPQEGGFIMYGNHQGMFDPVALALTCDRPLAVVFKKELANIPLVKQIVACTKSFAMDREDVRQSLSVIQDVTREVEAGRRYVIFPEGTRSRNGNTMGEFHHGSFRSAVKAKCPIVPLVFVDSFKVLDQKGSAPVSVQLHYLEPIPYEIYEGMKTSAIAEMVKEKIQQTLDQYTTEK